MSQAHPLAAGTLNVSQALAQANELHRQGRLAEAERVYVSILAARPDQVDALHYFGVLKLAQGQPGEALRLIGEAMRVRAPSPQLLLNHGLALNGLRRQQEALESFEQAIKLKSKYLEAHINRGVLLNELGRNEEALESFRKALAIKPNSADALGNRGNVLMALQRFDEAMVSYDRAIAARPDYADAHYNRSNLLKALMRFDEALAGYDRALALRPAFSEALMNRGTILHALNRFDEAVASYDRALALRPAYPEALYNRGMTLYDQKRFDEAIADYDRALALWPDFGEAYCNRGNALRDLKRFDEALASFDRAIALRPALAEAYSNRAMILQERKQLDEALAGYDRALALQPNFVDALSNRGAILQEMKRFDEAQANFEQVMWLKAVHPYAFSGVAACANNLCKWDRRAQLVTEMRAHVSERKSVVSAFTMLGYSDDPALQLQCARNYLDHRIPVLPAPMWTGQTWRNEKLRVAYLSADFRTHATAFLMAELFEKHDRARFEFIGVSFGVDEQSETRTRLVAAFDQFHDVHTKSDREVAELLRDLQVDIAVDLKGYTQEARPEILAHRAAPIQVNYLGYPGTMGAPFIDYILADETIAPFDHQPFYAEKIVQLPDCYQANDSKRVIAERTPSRSEAGLPEQGFVFCSFNNNWKISPDVFDVWMRLLQRVDGSVLWLLRDNDGAERNLRLEAQRRGVEPARLVFAERLSPPEHLARHRLANLFLDTLPCNAHTTASDSLWAGLPILTCLGGAFAGRVAASLLHGAGVPELITGSLNEYEALALKLASNPAMLAEVTAKLARNRTTCALFDAGRAARHIEAAYLTMWEAWQRGEAPKHFKVAPISPTLHP